MEEMQRAFNKTIIKLQNTSRIAQEQVGPKQRAVSKTRVWGERRMTKSFVFQDQRQTDSIQVLQSQLVNVTRLMLNLTTTVGQLQREVTQLSFVQTLVLFFTVQHSLQCSEKEGCLEILNDFRE